MLHTKIITTGTGRHNLTHDANAGISRTCAAVRTAASRPASNTSRGRLQCIRAVLRAHYTQAHRTPSKPIAHKRRTKHHHRTSYVVQHIRCHNADSAYLCCSGRVDRSPILSALRPDPQQPEVTSGSAARESVPTVLMESNLPIDTPSASGMLHYPKRFRHIFGSCGYSWGNLNTAVWATRTVFF